MPSVQVEFVIVSLHRCLYIEHPPKQGQEILNSKLFIIYCLANCIQTHELLTFYIVFIVFINKHRYI